ncbi:family 43 glycosylhydrolase [Planococcus donghaensis]|uniref:family 43 glycosylhydrolase n=1 Tax=Planococcus donghaensis TaxID=414778 RepID=UPI003735F29B
MQMLKIEEPVITTRIGSEPVLPENILVEFESGDKASVPVKWEASLNDYYNEAGKFQVHGQLQLLEYPNPLVEQRADPYIYKHTDGYYYFTGSYPEYDRIVLRRSKSIEGLAEAEETVIWTKREKGIMSLHIWAPEIHYIDGKWYIHYAAGDIDDIWAIRPYVLECESENPLEGEWSEKGQVNTDFNSFSLDATTFAHDGKRYLVWAQKVEEDTISNLYIAEMSNPWSIKNDQVLLSTPEFEWEQEGFFVNEGAAFISRNGKVFISYSGSATDDRYVMGLLTADTESDLLDPASWTKSTEPVFTSNKETEEFGPGHNSFTVAEDGETDLLVYHARPYKEIQGNPLYDHNRHARVQQLLWSEEGTPVFGFPGQTELLINRKIIASIEVR